MENKKRKQTDFEQLNPEVIEGLPKLSYKHELDIFDSIPNIQTVIVGKESVKIPPITALMQNTRVIDFMIPGYQNYVYNPSSLRLNLKLCVLKNDLPVGPRKPNEQEGEKEEEKMFDPVSVINNIAGSMFARVVLWINDVEAFSSNNLHSYRSWIEQSLTFSSNNKYAIIQPTQGFAEDVGTPDSTSFDENIGPFVRSEWTENGNILNLYGKLSHDCLNTDGKVFPPGTEIRLRLERNNDDFCLMWDEMNSPPSYKTAPPKYTLVLKSGHVEMDRYKLQEKAIDYISNKIAKQTARYYLTRVEMREQFIPLNTIEWTMELIFGLQIVPLRLFFGLCPVTSKNGTITTNPLCFKNHQLEEISIKINEKIIQVIKVGWKGSEMLEAYVHFLKALRILDKPSNIDIRMDDWSRGPMNLFGVDLSRDGSNASDPIEGAVSIGLRFRKPTTTALSAIIYGCYQGTLFIHGDKSVECYDSIVVKPGNRE